MIKNQPAEPETDGHIPEAKATSGKMHAWLAKTREVASISLLKNSFSKLKRSFQNESKIIDFQAASGITKAVAVLGKFKPEMIMLTVAFLGVILSQSPALTDSLISIKNNSDAFKLLAQHTRLNQKLTDIAAISTSKDSALPRIFAVASAAESNIEPTVLGASDSRSSTILTTSSNSTVVKPNYAVRPGIQAVDGPIGTYIVASGDTPQLIASRFGVSLATLLIENKLTPNSTIKPGQELRVLPVDGISYIVKAGDTLESLAEKYKADPTDILDANDAETDEDLLQVGLAIVIPQENLQLPQNEKPKTKIATNNTSKISLTTAKAPDISRTIGSLLWPTSSRIVTQYFGRRHNGLDIASPGRANPGPEIIAADDCFVEIAGWQSGGWGNTVICNHSNGLKTRYAHLSSIYVEAGQTLSRGDALGRMGNTGRSTGPHLHFTVYKNGTSVNPLLYVNP